MKPSAQALKKTGIATAVVLVIAILGVQTALLWELRSTGIEVTNPVEEVTVLNPAVEVLNPVEEVTILNPVEEVTVSNPVRSVRVLDPVREMSVTGLVDVGNIYAPVQTEISRADVRTFGRCSLGGDQYDLSIKALAGGVEHVVAEGRYPGPIAAVIGEYASNYYYGYSPAMSFGDSSEDCDGLEGWLAE